MLNIIFSFVALVFLLALIAYVLVLVANNSRILALTQQRVDLEAEELKAKIKNIMERGELEAKQVKLAWSGFRKFKIISKVKETDDISSFYLAPHDGKELPGFNPGQFLTFQVHLPNHPQPVIRCYSLSDSPFYPDRYRVTIKRILASKDGTSQTPGLVSNYFHDHINEGDIVDVKAPAGHFYLQMTKKTPVVFIAGGVGITPLLSMLNTITEMGSQREVWFFLGVRNKKEHMMREHLEMVEREFENVHLSIFYSNPEETDVLNEDYHHKGRITVEKIKGIVPSNNFDFYICAPPLMVKVLKKDLIDWGVPKNNIHFEAFGPDTVKGCKPDAGKKDGAKLNVKFERSGKTLVWEPNIASLLDFAEANGISIDSGCRAGNCGTCLTAIKSGSVELVGEPGSEPESGSCLTCISIPRGDISLDA
ncbi:MAG: 2Fe-2S iron-sulfur cluster binding domain-containing protein [Nitrospinae bacterium]|nr:2Fe-2S iron-sulfur cluster binding domain-containing protein [Nitrospinota bacterium]